MRRNYKFFVITGLLLAIAAVARAQVTPVPDTTFPSFRSLMNANFTYLASNKLQWQGSWAAGTYNQSDVVAYNGNVWVSLAGSNTATPAVGMFWAQLGSSGAVSSVFGRTGAVTAQSGDYTTAQVTESGNLYFNNARAIAATLTGYVSGAGTISSSDSLLSAIQKLNGNIAAGAFNAATATAFQNAPTTCSSGQGTTGINASGNAQGCTTYVQLAGDLSGTAASPTVAKIQGNAVKSGTPSNGNVLTWVTTNSDWEPTAPTGGWSAPPVGTLYLQDDFLPYTGTGQLSWRECCGTYSNISAASTTVGHPGVRQMQTGSTSGNTSSELLNTTGTAPFFSLGTNSEFTAGWNSRFVYLIDSGSVNGAVSADSTWICVGFNAISATSCTSGDSIMVYAASSAPITCTSGSWVAADMMFVVVSGSTRQCIDTGIAASTSTWYDVLFQSTTLGTVSATVNGTLCAGCTVSANVPTTTVSPQFMVYTQTTASKTLWADYFQFVGMGLSR